MFSVPPVHDPVNGSLQRADGYGRIAALDGWRAISALMVIAGHMLPIDNAFAWLGVDIFFGISGYIICRGFIQETATLGQVSLAGFYVRRIFRILPPLMMYVAAIIALMHFGVVGGEVKDIARTLTFTCNFPSSNCNGWLGGHTWSLSVEEQFYLTIPVIFISLGSYRRIALTVLAFSLPFVVVALYAVKFTDAASFLANFVTISFGVAAALNESFMRRLVAASPRGATVAAILVIVGISQMTGTRVGTALSVLCIGPLIAFVLLSTISQPSLAHRFLSMHWLSSLGRVSYSLYLWQQLASYPFIERPSALDGTFFLRIFAVAACVLVAFSSYELVERRLIKLGAKISRRLQQASSFGPKAA